MTRRQPLQYDVENLRDLVDGEPATKPSENSERILDKPLKRARDQFEQIFDPNAFLIAQYGPASKFRQQGPIQREVRNLMQEYGNRTPQERLELLAAIQMSPQEMAVFFDLACIAPDLPQADPVLAFCNRNNASKPSDIVLDSITMQRDNLWKKAIRLLREKAEITSLEDLKNANPKDLKEIHQFGDVQCLLCAEVLRARGLLTKDWSEYLKKNQES